MKGVPEVKSVTKDQRAIKESLDLQDLQGLMAKLDPGVPQGFRDLLAKQGPEVKLVREDIEAIKE